MHKEQRVTKNKLHHGDTSLVEAVIDINAATVYYNLLSVCQGYNKVDKRLVITTCANQDPLQATTGNMIFID